MANTESMLEQLNKLSQEMSDLSTVELKAVEELNKLRIRNAERLVELQINNLNRLKEKELNLQQQVNEEYIRSGGDARVVVEREAYKARLQAIEDEFNARIAAASEAEKEILEKEKQQRLDNIHTEFNERLEGDADFRKEMAKLDAKDAKARKKQRDKEYSDAVSTAQGALGSNLSSIFSKKNLEKAKENIKEQNPDLTDAEINDLAGRAQADAAYKALAGFAKQLSGVANSIAEAQAEVDTRLYGSGNKKTLGSYWRKMYNNISSNVGVSPFLRQETAVNNLKTLVSQGIAFNVEQRAFLQTIKDKIATTFDATDGTLKNLIRIQQADSTAARLGMEAALNAFLNNMYETTEYMEQAADAIRGSLYEASALMTAEGAADFEYQVQKWMGSLYSVGFSNTQSLADALGKLAAGEIDSITGGGTGNLLVMAANKAGISVSDILANGLDDSETNALMKAMVGYLSDIYEETKNNKVVAQQFANVYGLTASDLKAAANLASSTTDVYKNNLNYGGMLKNLKAMANSMWQRTGLGNMVSNIWENFKYTTAANIGVDPVLYTTYMIADVLDEAVGGIAIPSIGAWAMGNGTEIDLETTVADIMRTGAMAGGLLGGIGKMLGGIASGAGGGLLGAGMLKAFGVNLDGSRASTIVRGTGDGLLTTASGMDTSFSTFIGNEDSSSIVDKMVGDEKDKANEQAVKALDEAKEVGIDAVDNHIVQIYDLLDSVVSGSRKIHITYGGIDAWETNPGISSNGNLLL